jgi:peptide deformylase
MSETKTTVAKSDTIEDIEAETQREINEMLAQLEAGEGVGIEVDSDVEVMEAQDFESELESESESEDGSLEETVGTPSEEESELTHMGSARSGTKPSKVVPMRTPGADSMSSSEEGSLSLKLSGKMKLDLEYVTSGHRVTVSFQEEAFVVQLDGGAEFRLPFKKAA